MAYREPGVTVTQEFANALPALGTFALPNVVVGPVFQIVKNAVAGIYSGSQATFGFSGKLAGAIADLSAADSTDPTDMPITVSLKSAVVALLSGTAGVVSGAASTTFTDETADAFAGVVAGDVINVASGSLAGSYTIRSVIDANNVQTNEQFSGASAGVAYTIRRNVGDVAVTNFTSTADGVSVPAAIAVELLPVIQASVVISYRALRLENSMDVKEYKNQDDLMADFGVDQIVPENTAVFGAYLALNNAVTATNLLGLGQTFLSDEVLAYSAALDILKLSDMYAITVMTQNTAVHTALKAHVEQMSDPAVKMERVGIVNRKLITKTVVTNDVADAATDVAGTKLTSISSHFITDGVVPGHFANIAGQRIAIASVDSQTQLTLVSTAGASLAGQTLFIDRDLQKSEQAAAIAAYARSLGSRRMVLTFPDIVKAPAGNLIRPLPGYFLNTAVAALTTGLPTQQGLTNLSVAIFTGVVHSTKYFDNDQLNTIADGGVMIFVQDVPDQSALYIRHQLTTDRTAIKFQEFSVTKNVDFIAKFVRNYHKGFIGQYNIVDNTFDDLKTSAKGITKYLTEKTKRPRIGGVIRSGQLKSIVQDPVNIDSIAEQYTFDIPIPLNNLDITIVV